MIFNKQLIKHDPVNGIFGDCMRTAIACLLDKLPEEVPHFGEHFLDSATFDAAVNSYLASQGLAQFTIAFHGECGIKSVIDTVGFTNKNMYYLLSGQSNRKVNHIVVCCENKIIHDPHPSGDGLEAPCNDGYFWATVLVPALMKREEA